MQGQKCIIQIDIGGIGASPVDIAKLQGLEPIAMDATRLPRGMKFEVKPGKAILTNGAPSEILYPFKFGQSDPNNLATAKDFERMLLQATGTLDSQGMISNVARDGGHFLRFSQL